MRGPWSLRHRSCAVGICKRARHQVVTVRGKSLCPGFRQRATGISLLAGHSIVSRLLQISTGLSCSSAEYHLNICAGHGGSHWFTLPWPGQPLPDKASFSVAELFKTMCRSTPTLKKKRCGLHVLPSDALPLTSTSGVADRLLYPGKNECCYEHRACAALHQELRLFLNLKHQDTAFPTALSPEPRRVLATRLAAEVNGPAPDTY